MRYIAAARQHVDIENGFVLFFSSTNKVKRNSFKATTTKKKKTKKHFEKFRLKLRYDKPNWIS